MEKKSIIVCVFILELSGVFGVSISRREVNNDIDVYKVNEDRTTNSLTFVNPKPEKPTLREIIYYHIIETPYEQVINEHLIGNDHKLDNVYNVIDNGHNILDNDYNILVNDHNILDNGHNILEDDENKLDNDNMRNKDHNILDNEHNIVNDKIEGIYFDDNHRPWTNGHGYQYFNTKPEDQDKPTHGSDSLVDDDTDDVVIHPQPQGDPVLPNVNAEDHSDEADLAAKPSAPVNGAMGTDLEARDDDGLPDGNSDDADEVRESSTAAAPAQDLPKTAVDVDSIKNIGWMNFIQNSEERRRRKREVHHSALEEPPTLPPLNLDVLPDFIRAMLATDIPEIIKESHATNINMDEPEEQIAKLEDTVEQISDRRERSAQKEGRTYGMSLTGDSGTVWNNLNNVNTSYPVGATNNEIEEIHDAPPELGTSRVDGEVYDKKDQLENELDEAGSKEELTKGTKTYGMTLTGDSGLVWNNVNTNTSHPVGARNNVLKVNKTNGVQETEDVKPAIRASRDDDEIDAKIDKFENELDKAGSKEKPNVEEPIKGSKTYGMSLIGGHGVVWNDLSGNRVSYSVGAPTEETTTEIIISENTTETDLDNALDEVFKPSDENGEISKPDLSQEINDAFNEINHILDDISKEKDNPQNNTNNALVNEIVDIIKEVFKNKTAKLENNAHYNRTNNTNYDMNGNEESKDDENHKTSEVPDSVEEVIKKDEFWQWLDDWSTAYLDLLMNRIDNHIKEEVAKQIEEYFSNHDKNKPGDNEENMGIQNKATNNDTINGIKVTTDPDGHKIEESVDGDEDYVSEKKRKCKDCEDKKDSPVKIAANTVYGNSVGNGKVTNVFIFNVNNKSDLDNIKPLVNGTNGIYVFGNNDIKPDSEENINRNESLTNPQDIKTEETNKEVEENNNDSKTLQETEEVSTKIPEYEDSKRHGDATSTNTKEKDKKENHLSESETSATDKDATNKDDDVDIDQRFGSGEINDTNADKKDERKEQKDISSTKEVTKKEPETDKNNRVEVDENKENTDKVSGEKAVESNEGPDKDNVKETNKSKGEPDKVSTEQVVDSNEGPDKDNVKETNKSKEEPDKVSTDQVVDSNEKPDKDTVKETNKSNEEPDKVSTEQVVDSNEKPDKDNVKETNKSKEEPDKVSTEQVVDSNEKPDKDNVKETNKSKEEPDKVSTEQVVYSNEKPDKDNVKETNKSKEEPDKVSTEQVVNSNEGPDKDNIKETNKSKGEPDKVSTEQVVDSNEKPDKDNVKETNKSKEEPDKVSTEQVVDSKEKPDKDNVKETNKSKEEPDKVSTKQVVDSNEKPDKEHDSEHDNVKETNKGKEEPDKVSTEQVVDSNEKPDKDNVKETNKSKEDVDKKKSQVDKDTESKDKN